MEDEKELNKVAKATIISASGAGIVYYVIISLIGLFALFIGVFSAIHCLTYVETTATIVDAKYDSSMECYVPIYEFKYNDEIVRADGIGTSNKNKDDIIIGSEEIINYNTKNYKQFDVGSKEDTLIIMIISIIILIISISYICKNIKLIKSIKNNERE